MKLGALIQYEIETAIYLGTKYTPLSGYEIQTIIWVQNKDRYLGTK